MTSGSGTSAADARGVGGDDLSATAGEGKTAAGCSPSTFTTATGGLAQKGNTLKHTSAATATAAGATSAPPMTMHRWWLTFADPETELAFRIKHAHAVLYVGSVLFIALAVPTAAATIFAMSPDNLWLVTAALWLRLVNQVATAGIMYQLWLGCPLSNRQVLWRLELAVYSSTVCEVFGKAFTAGFNGLPVPSSVLFSTAATFATGLPWYRQVSFGVLGSLVHVAGQWAHDGVGGVCTAALVDTFAVGLPFLAVLCYVSDQLIRRNFQMKAAITGFGVQLDKVVTNFVGRGGAHEQLGELAARTADGAAAAGTAGADAGAGGREQASMTFHTGGVDLDVDAGVTRALEITLQRAQRVHTVLAESEARQATFLATMSHELRSPLTGVLGLVELLAADTRLPLDALELARAAQSSGEHLRHVVNDILDFSKISCGTRFSLVRAAFCPTQLLRKVKSLFALPAQSKRVDLRLEFSPDGLLAPPPPATPPAPALAPPVQLLGDDMRVQQILFNLVSNAIKFTAAGGSVSIHADLSAPRQDAAMHGCGGGSGGGGGGGGGGTSPSTPQLLCLTVSVTDTGIGIAPEAVQRLFTPFTQADDSTTRTFGGTGLGLAISAELARLMGCPRIEVDSQVGHGSTFTVRLLLEPAPLSGAEGGSDDGRCGGSASNGVPAAECLPHRAPASDTPTAAAAAAALGEDARLAPLAGLRLLVVDDSNTIRMVSERLLTKAGARVTTACDGQEALDIIAAVASGTASAGVDALASAAAATTTTTITATSPGFDLVLMDHHMPVTSGLEATRTIQTLYGAAAPPVVGLTADVMHGTTTEFLQSGAVAVEHKPLQMARLTATVLRHARGRRQQQQ